MILNLYPMLIQDSEETYLVIAGLHLGNQFTGVRTCNYDGDSIIVDNFTGRVFPETFCRCVSKPFQYEPPKKVRLHIVQPTEDENDEPDEPVEKPSRMRYHLQNDENAPEVKRKRGASQFDWLKEMEPGEHRIINDLTWSQFTSLRTMASITGKAMGRKYGCHVVGEMEFKITRKI